MKQKLINWLNRRIREESMKAEKTDINENKIQYGAKVTAFHQVITKIKQLDK